jgi:hypothetical protein
MPSDEEQAGTRIWRVRRRGEWIDAGVHHSAGKWRLQLTRRGRLIGDWDFETREDAIDAAGARRQELERAGWTEHW